jgi:hypothetical protein
MRACEPASEAPGHEYHRPTGLEEEIRRRAFEIWEEHGKCDGEALHDWLRAEAEVLTHRVMRKVA